MRFVSAVLAIAFLVLGSVNAGAQELTKEQEEPWSALEKQIALFLKRDWEKHDEYIHPKAIIGGDDFPMPVTADRLKKYDEALFADSDEVMAHYLTPVTVTVVGDVAIINAYCQVLTKKDSKKLESTWRLHNTWKKENGRWRLLATYNAEVRTSETDDD